MRKPKGGNVLMWALLAVPVLWLAAVLAYGYEDGMNLFDLMGVLLFWWSAPFP